MMKTTLGIDYASVDEGKPPNMAAAKKAGMEFAILRASYGVSQDATFQRDWKKLKAAGLVRGAYLFPVMSKTREPEPQIAAFVQAVKEAGGLYPGKDLPPVLDVEFSKGIKATGLTRLQCVDWVNRACVQLEEAFGCLPMIYTSARVWDGQDDDSLDLSRVPTPALADCPLWLARYPYKAGIISHHAPSERDGIAVPAVPAQLGDATDVFFHQYQGDAIGFPGFSSTVDLNRFFPLSMATAEKGSEKVKWIQRKLGVTADGVWGPMTERSLRAFRMAKLIPAPAFPAPAVVDLCTFCALSWA